MAHIRTTPEFIKLKEGGKTPLELFNNRTMHSWDEVQDHPDVALLVQKPITVIDIDTAEDCHKLERMLDDTNTRPPIVRTTRGAHYYFKTPKPLKSKADTTLMTGLHCDIKSWGGNAYVKVQTDGKPRQGWAENVLKQAPTLPEYLYPVDGADSFLGKTERGKRNDTLFRYSYHLQHLGYEPKAIATAIRLANRYVLAEPLPDSEVDLILRKDSFKSDIKTGNRPWFKVTEGKRGGKQTEFLHHVLAEHLYEIHHVINTEDGQYFYDSEKGYYARLTDEAVLHLIIKEYPESTVKERNEVLKAIQAQTYIKTRPKQDTYILNVKNGRLNLKTGELTEHTPAAYDFQQVPTKYDPEVASPVLDQVVRNLFPSDDLEALFEEMLGHCLIKNLAVRGAFYLVGDGANGKSTVLNLIRRMLGEDNVSVLVPHQITVDSFHTAELHNKLANIGDDVGKNRITDNQAYKKAVTGEPLLVSRKYEQPFKLHSYATLIFAANEMPHDYDHSYGADSRRIIVPLGAQFKPNDPNYDPYIGEKLRCPDVMTALLNRALDGAQRLLRNGKLTVPKEVTQAQKQYLSTNTYVAQWVEDMIFTDEDWTPLEQKPKDLRSEFFQWLSDSKIRNTGYSPQRFNKELFKCYPNYEVKNTSRDGKSVKIIMEK